MKLKQIVPAGQLLDKLRPSRNGDEEEQAGGRRRGPTDADPAVGRRGRSGRGRLEALEQYEDYPKFMHRLQSAEKIDPKHVHFEGKIWGISRDWDAKITEKRTHEAIAWTSEDGLDNSGVVTFHKLAPRLTRVELSLDVNPHGPIEKIGRGMRFTKRAVRADLHRFKAYAEMNEG